LLVRGTQADPESRNPEIHLCRQAEFQVTQVQVDPEIQKSSRPRDPGSSAAEQSHTAVRLQNPTKNAETHRPTSETADQT